MFLLPSRVHLLWLLPLPRPQNRATGQYATTVAKLLAGVGVVPFPTQAGVVGLQAAHRMLAEATLLTETLTVVRLQQ